MARQNGRCPKGCLRARVRGLVVMLLVLMGPETRGQVLPAQAVMPTAQAVSNSCPGWKGGYGASPVGFVGLAPGRYQFALGTVECPRKYVVHVPRSCNPQLPAPVVVALHGAGGSADTFLDESNWAERAECRGFLAVAPEGLPLQPSLPSNPLANPRVWNSGQYGEQRARTRIDDVAFIIAVLDDVSSRCWVDQRRVFTVGYSNGGAMAFRLGAERADRFTAIASVGGLCWIPQPNPSRALPTLVMFGTLDPLMPLHGGLKVLPWEIRLSPPVRTVMSRWAAAIGCPTEPHPAGWSPAPGVRVEDYGPSWSGSLLRVMYVRLQGHAWPGGRSLRPERLLGPDISSLDATEEISKFFGQWAW